MKKELTKSSLEKATGCTYILLIYLYQPHCLLIGKLGWNHFKEGYYLYVGSAKKLIKQRLMRHLLRQKNRFWHIDYLLSDPSPSVIKDIWLNQIPCECSVAQELLQNKICMLVKKGFGSSDCQCISHFFRIHESDIDILYQLLSKMKFYSLR